RRVSRDPRGIGGPAASPALSRASAWVSLGRTMQGNLRGLARNDGRRQGTVRRDTLRRDTVLRDTMVHVPADSPVRPPYREPRPALSRPRLARPSPPPGEPLPEV